MPMTQFNALRTVGHSDATAALSRVHNQCVQTPTAMYAFTLVSNLASSIEPSGM